MERLSGIDAAMLYLETPTLHMHTIKVAVLEPSADADYSLRGVRRELAHRLDRLSPLRRRLVQVPLGLDHPVWVDAAPDLDRHVRRVRVPPPGGTRELDTLVGEIAGVPLDLRLPPWELTIADGLAGGRVAVVAKIHHALADGVAIAHLLAGAMEPGTGSTIPAIEAPPSPVGLVRDALVDRGRELLRLPALLRRTAGNLAAVVRRRRTASGVPPLPLRDVPWTPINGALTPARAFASASLSLDEVRLVRAAFGVTMNDVLLALVAGALRRYLLARGALPEQALVAEVPVSTDTSPRLAGNRLSNLFTSLCTDVPDRVARLRAIHAVATEAKTMHDLLGPDLYGAWTIYAPPPLLAWLTRQYSRFHLADRHRPFVNVIVSCVPGPRERLQWSGGRLEGLFSVGPIIEGAALNVTAWSYADRLNVGVLACPRQVPDPHQIGDGLAEELRLLGRSARRIRPRATTAARSSARARRRRHSRA